MAEQNVVRTLTIRGRADGIDQLEAKVRELASAQDTLTISSEQQEKAALRVDAALKRLQTRYDQEFRAQTALAQAQKTLQAAQAQGLVTSERAAQLMQSAIKYHNQTSVAQDKMAGSSKLARYELINLSRQVQDVGVSLASGQAPMTVFLQQGTQIADVFASSRATLRGFASQVASIITPMRLAAAGIVGLAAGAVLLARNWATVELQFDATARTIGVSVQRLHELQTAAEIKGVSQSEFFSGMEQFSGFVQQAKLNMGQLADLLRVNGMRAKDFEDALSKVATLVNNAATDERRIQILRAAGLPATIQMVDALKKITTETHAQRTATDELNEQLIKKAREADEAWTEFWKNFGQGARNAFVEAVSGAIKLRELGRQGIAAIGDLVGSDENAGKRFVGKNLLSKGFGQSLEGDVYKGIGAFKLPADQKGPPAPALHDELQTMNQREQQRIQLLGNLATAQEKVRLKQLELDAAGLNGVGVTDKQAAALLRLAAAEEKSRRLGEQVGALGEAATTTEQYAAAVASLEVKLADTTLSQEQFNRAVAAANPLVRELNSRIQGELVSGLADVFDGTKTVSEGFADLGKSIIRALDEAIIKLLIVKPLMDALISPTAGIGSFLPKFGVAHAGGVVGQTRFPIREVGFPAIAPRLHSGLASDEMFAILQRGERVIPKGQAASGQAGNVTVEVNNYSSSSASVQQQDDGRGNRKIQIQIDEMVSSALQRPGSRSQRAAKGAGSILRRS